MEKKIDSKILLENYKKILIIISPAVPHYASECLEDLNCSDKKEWPEAKKEFLVSDKVDYVIQINGKKRAILNESRDLDQESLLVKAKSNKLTNKYLEGKSINKIIFVKNRLMNLLINE